MTNNMLQVTIEQYFFFQPVNFPLWHTIHALAVQVICIDLVSKRARKDTASVTLSIRLAGSSLHNGIFCWQWGICQSSGQSWHHKATQSCRCDSFHLITIYSCSGHHWAVHMHPPSIFLHSYFLSLQKRTRTGFTKSLHLHNYHMTELQCTRFLCCQEYFEQGFLEHTDCCLSKGCLQSRWRVPLPCFVLTCLSLYFQLF